MLSAVAARKAAREAARPPEPVAITNDTPSPSPPLLQETPPPRPGKRKPNESVVGRAKKKNKIKHSKDQRPRYFANTSNDLDDDDIAAVDPVEEDTQRDHREELPFFEHEALEPESL